MTVLAPGALWVQAVPTRLGIAITAFLTLIAVQVRVSLPPASAVSFMLSTCVSIGCNCAQWTVSHDLPVSADETWLGQLSDLCVCFTALVSVLGFGVGYLHHHQESEVGGDAGCRRQDASSLSFHMLNSASYSS